MNPLTDTHEHWTVERMAQHIVDTALAGRYRWGDQTGWLKYADDRWITASEISVAEAARLAVIDFHTAVVRAGANPDRIRTVSNLLSARGVWHIVRLARDTCNTTARGGTE